MEAKQDRTDAVDERPQLPRGAGAQWQTTSPRLVNSPPLMRANRSAIEWCLVNHPTRGHVCLNERRDSDLDLTLRRTPSPISSLPRGNRFGTETCEGYRFRDVRPAVPVIRRQFIARPLGVTMTSIRTEELPMASDGADPWNKIKK
jgi:hypothetical protein